MPRKQVSPINEDFDFKLFVTIARKNIWWFVLFMAISFTVAFLILRYTAPLYEASSIIKLGIEDKAKNVLDQVGKDDGGYDAGRIAGDIELIRSRIIVERALNTLPVRISYYSQGTVLENELYKQSPFEVEIVVKDSAIYGDRVMIDFENQNTVKLTYPLGKGDNVVQNFPVNKWIVTPMANFKITITNYKEITKHQQELQKDAYFFIIQTNRMIYNQLANDLFVAPLNLEAKTIQIKVRGKNSHKIADIANAVAREFIKYDVEKNSEVTRKILEFIDLTIKSIDTDLSKSETSLESFKRNNKIISPDIAVADVSVRIKEISKELDAVNFELDLYKRIRNDLNEENDLTKFILSVTGSSDENGLLSMLDKLKSMLDERDIVLTQTTTNSEMYRIITSKINSQKDIILKTLSNEEANLIAKQKVLIAQSKDFEGKFGRIPAQQAEFGRLQRFFNINEKFYSLLLEKKAEFSITKAGYVPLHIVLQDALFNVPPVSPNKSLIISACLMIGFLVSFGLIIVRYLLYNEINALEEVGLYTDAALLGIIPKYKREIPVSQLLVDKNPKSVISEAFRSIRTNLQFISNEDGAKVMAVTSTISGEGKTFNAINLAGVIAFSGKKVVILDLDMRKPKIHIGFNVENNHGMSTLLIGKDLPDDCIKHSTLPNLDFITAGPIPPNPAELIINPRMDELIVYLKKKYDIIICDTPPVGIVSDGIPIIQRADYPLYILRANYSRKMFITQINKLMTDNKVTGLSVILNGVELSRIKYGYGYGYSYGYGYGYGYSYGYGYYEDDDQPPNFFQRIKLMVTGK
ncbi:MAG: polysaccharide biosynthesis tyrosine autokinase [Bacteroidota bacterium]